MPMEISTTTPPTLTLPPDSTRIQPLNGAIKRRLPSPHPPPPPPPAVYKECLKNHAAARGGHALDGCCEFLLSPSSTALNCAACGCHRNFHRREPPSPAVQPPPHFTEYLPHHRHLPPPPGYGSLARSPNSHSPPPISSSYYPNSAPHALFPLNSAPARGNLTAPAFGRKRIRTKFSQEQKEKMLGFAEKIGWKMQRGSDESVAKFCGEIGVERGVFKVWMHNHKNSFFKRDLNVDFGNAGNNGSSGNNSKANGSSSTS